MTRIRIAVDAMGGDRAPDEIVAGALQAVDDAGVDVLLVGPEATVRALLPDGTPPRGVTLVDAPDVIGMHDDPASSVRTRPAASPLRCARAGRGRTAGATVA